MALIVASFDDWLTAGGDDEVLIQRINGRLDRDINLHEATIHDWRLSDESDGIELFSVTPLMRHLWSEHRSGRARTST